MDAARDSIALHADAARIAFNRRNAVERLCEGDGSGALAASGRACEDEAGREAGDSGAAGQERPAFRYLVVPLRSPVRG